jgi:adenylate cyclase
MAATMPRLKFTITFKIAILMLRHEHYKPAFYSGINGFRIRRVIYIAIVWTIIDIVTHLLNTDISEDNFLRELVFRSILVFVMSCFMGYLFVFTFRTIFSDKPLWVHFLSKSFLVILAAGLMNLLVYILETAITDNRSLSNALTDFFQNKLSIAWVTKRMLYWLVIFSITQLFIEINDKYAPGIFISILSGKYKKPVNENRIIMFMDLKDSTPIAEKLGHEDYFLFIREFIVHISNAIITHEGIIYQYVGDEVVVSWPLNKKNTKKALASIIEARRNIQKASEDFRREFDIAPEFRVGIHAGEVTIGEIGVMKKDLAMSGDTMNTTARIRSACNELNQKFIVSKEFAEYAQLDPWQFTSLGNVELKGKSDGIELFALNL